MQKNAHVHFQLDDPRMFGVCMLYMNLTRNDTGLTSVGEKLTLAWVGRAEPVKASAAEAQPVVRGGRRSPARRGAPAPLGWDPAVRVARTAGAARPGSTGPARLVQRDAARVVVREALGSSRRHVAPGRRGEGRLDVRGEGGFCVTTLHHQPWRGGLGE